MEDGKPWDYAAVKEATHELVSLSHGAPEQLHGQNLETRILIAVGERVDRDVANALWAIAETVLAGGSAAEALERRLRALNQGSG